eukprot:TRINITY_DN8098_c0_g2_i1.p1 TRINITY_DN8098_c0_g2~~TRINITY_DN8098_c0_g2_i1.p1  ORF type:complete len:123 (-),score=5.10 TRINITY_DN8098_c0_g2_i1:100-468(-)
MLHGQVLQLKPSTGFLAVLAALQHCDTLSLYGFKLCNQAEARRSPSAVRLCQVGGRGDSHNSMSQYFCKYYSYGLGSQHKCRTFDHAFVVEHEMYAFWHQLGLLQLVSVSYTHLTLPTKRIV